MIDDSALILERRKLVKTYKNVLPLKTAPLKIDDNDKEKKKQSQPHK